MRVVSFPGCVIPRPRIRCSSNAARQARAASPTNSTGAGSMATRVVPRGPANTSSEPRVNQAPTAAAAHAAASAGENRWAIRSAHGNPDATKGATGWAIA